MLTKEEIKDILDNTKPTKASIETMMWGLLAEKRILDFLVTEEDGEYGCYFKTGDEDHQFEFFNVPYFK